MVRAVQGDFGNRFTIGAPACHCFGAPIADNTPPNALCPAACPDHCLSSGDFHRCQALPVYDHLATVAVLLGQSMPVFWTGIMLILLFAVGLNLFPVSAGNHGWRRAPDGDAWGLSGTVVLAYVTLSHA